MSHYLFHEAGVIPGLPGTFANCRVDVDDDGTLTVTPLSLAGLTYSGGGGSLIVREVLEAPQADAPTDVADAPTPVDQPVVAPVEPIEQVSALAVDQPASETAPPPSEPTSPPATNGG